MKFVPNPGDRVRFVGGDTRLADGTVLRTFCDPRGKWLVLVDWDDCEPDDVDERIAFYPQYLQLVSRS